MVKVTPSILSILSMFVLSAVALSDEPAPTPKSEVAPNFTLPDSMKGLVRVKWPREKPVFLTFGEQASQAALEAWGQRMRKEFTGRMDFIGVAWLEAIPENLHATAETIIRTTRPDVLLDKTGSAAEKYQCKLGSVNAFVIAPDGTILHRIHEPMTEERFAAVKQSLQEYFDASTAANEPTPEEKKP